MNASNTGLWAVALASLLAACSSSSQSPAPATTGAADAGIPALFDASSADGWTLDEAGADAGSPGLVPCTWDQTSWDGCLWQ
jgi:hypothetical protein